MVDRNSTELAKQLLEEFWLLSLCLENLLEEECWEELSPLLQKRQEILNALERLSPEPEWIPKLERILAVDRRCQQHLQQLRTQLLEELNTEVQQRRCGERYLSAEPGTTSLFEESS